MILSLISVTSIDHNDIVPMHRIKISAVIMRIQHKVRYKGDTYPDTDPTAKSDIARHGQVVQLKHVRNRSEPKHFQINYHLIFY